MTGLRVWLHPSSRTMSAAKAAVKFLALNAALKGRSSTALYASSFWGTASVVRDGRHVFDGAHFNTRCREGADGRFAAGTGAGYADIYAPHAVIARHVGCG